MTTAFSSVPVVDFGHLQASDSKEEELKRLHNAMFGVGFLYLTNTGLEVRLAMICSLLQNANTYRPGSSEGSTRKSARVLQHTTQLEGTMPHAQLTFVLGIYRSWG